MTSGAGKGVWLWEIAGCEGGNVEAIIKKAKAANLTRLIVKVADGRQEHKANKGRYGELLVAMRESGLEVWVWGYCYAKDPAGEAEFQANLANELKADCYVADIEGEYEGAAEECLEFAQSLRVHLDKHITSGLSTFYRPDLHPIDWNALCPAFDFVMPQVYWHGNDPVASVLKSVQAFDVRGWQVIPSLAAYPALSETKALHTPDELVKAIESCQLIGVKGFDFWDWQHMTGRHWEVVSQAQTDPNAMQVVYDGKSIACNARVENGVTRADLRSLMESLGYTVKAEGKRITVA